MNPFYKTLKTQKEEREKFLTNELKKIQKLEEPPILPESTIIPDSNVFMTAVQVDDMKPLSQDIFCFYSLKVDLPKSFFTKLGDEAIVSE